MKKKATVTGYPKQFEHVYANEQNAESAARAVGNQFRISSQIVPTADGKGYILKRV